MTKKKTKKRKLKPLSQLYGDFMYNTKSIKKSQNTLVDKANVSLRTALSDMWDLQAKTYFLVKGGESSRAELKKISGFGGKLLQLVDDFKYSMMR